VRGAAERGRGQDAPLIRAGLAIGARRAANASHAGSLPDGGPSGSIDREDQRILDSRTQGRGLDPADVAGRLDLHRHMELGLRPVLACVRATCRARSHAGANSRGGGIPGEHRPNLPYPGQGEGDRWTDSRGEQSFEAGVPAIHRRARFGRATDRGRRAHARTTERSSSAGNRRPGPCVRWTLGWTVAKGRLGGESGVKGSPGPRRRSSNANPQGSKRGPRERVRLLERGTLWRESSRERERHETRPQSLGATWNRTGSQELAPPRSQPEPSGGNQPWGRHWRGSGSPRLPRTSREARPWRQGHPW